MQAKINTGKLITIKNVGPYNYEKSRTTKICLQSVSREVITKES